MSSLRKMIETSGALAVGVLNDKPTKATFKANETVVIRRPQGFGRQRTTEVIVGKILAQNGDNYQVSIPRPGGATLRATVSASQLSKVTKDFKRSSVQFNAAFRGQI